MGLFYWRFSDDAILSILFFLLLPILYFSSLNVIRQFMAVALFAYSLRYIVERSFVKYAIFIILASIAHKSALILLPGYFLFGIRLSLFSYIFVGLGFFLSLSFLPVIISYSGFSLIYLDLYKSEGVNAMSVLMLLFFVVYFYFNQVFGEKGRGNDVLWMNMVFASVLISFSPLFSELAGLVFLRLSTYFTFVLPIVVIRFKYFISGSYSRLFYQCVMVAFLFAYYFMTLVSRGEELKLVPYNCVFC